MVKKKLGGGAVAGVAKSKKKVASDDEVAPPPALDDVAPKAAPKNAFALLNDDDDAGSGSGSGDEKPTPVPSKKEKAAKSSSKKKAAKAPVTSDDDAEAEDLPAPVPVKLPVKAHKAAHGTLAQRRLATDSLDSSASERASEDDETKEITRKDDAEFLGWKKEDRKASEKKLKAKASKLRERMDTPEPQDRKFDLDDEDETSDTQQSVASKGSKSKRGGAAKGGNAFSALLGDEDADEPADAQDEVDFGKKKSKPSKSKGAKSKKVESEDEKPSKSSKKAPVQSFVSSDEGEEAPFKKQAAPVPSKKDKKKKKKGVSEDEADELADKVKSVSLAAGQSSSKTYGPGMARTLGRGVDGEVRADGSFAAASDFLTVTGTSVSDETSKDIMIDQFSMAAFGQTMVKDTTLKLIYGRRYGLIGPNGCGKSTLLRMLGRREVPIQNSIDIFLLDREFDPTDLTAVEAVVDIVKTEKEALENEQEELLSQPNGHEDPRFEVISDRINDLDLDTAERRAKDVLFGLGFSPEMQQMKTREFSGGWRMRISLARALFVKPTLLLLDEPTNHLDLGACVWLEEYIKKYKHTILFVSHSQDFLNGVCTDIIHMHNRKLDYYTGDYDGFMHAREEKDEYLKKRAKAEEKQVKKMQDTVAKLGQKVAKQAKQKEKAMLKKNEKVADLKDELVVEKELKIRFNDCGRGIPPPVLQFRDVSFGYAGRKELFKDVTFGLDLDSRVALVGPNGAGKSTLLKLMVGQGMFKKCVLCTLLTIGIVVFGSASNFWRGQTSPPSSDCAVPSTSFGPAGSQCYTCRLPCQRFP